MNKEVEVLKIGTIISSIISKQEIDDGKKKSKDTIMFVYNGGPLFDHYVNILKEKCVDDYKYLKTDKSIVGSINTNQKFGKSNKLDTLKGIQNNDPVVGQSYGVESWYTSTVNKIIDEDILITRNSVYAIHNLSKIRDKKLNDLGIN